MIVKTKLCKKCGEEKSLDEFSRDKSHSDGHFSLCKKCKSAYKKKHKARDTERYLALAAGCRKRYEVRHPERVKAQKILNKEAAIKRHNQDPDVIKARQEREARKKDRALHPEKYKALENEKQRARWAGLSTEDREMINAQARDRYANDPVFRAKEKEREKRRSSYRNKRAKRRRIENPEKYRARDRIYHAKNRERIIKQERANRSKRKAEQTKFMLLKAMDIIQDEFTKGSDHEEKLEKIRAKKKDRRAKERERFYERNPEKLKARQEREAKKKDKALHPEKYKKQIREKQRAHYAANREKILAKAKTDYAQNPEKYRAYRRTFEAKHPEKYQGKQRDKEWSLIMKTESEFSHITTSQLVEITGKSIHTIYNWRTKCGLPRNIDKTFDLRIFFLWYEQFIRKKRRHV